MESRVKRLKEEALSYQYLKKTKQIVLLSFLIFLSVQLSAQKKATTLFGIQFKPIFSSEIVNTGPQSNIEGRVNFNLEQKLGYGFGMVIRKELTKQLNLETGINFTQRNYDLSIQVDSINFVGLSDFRYVIYEIPIKGLVYVRMGQNTYLNASFGSTIDILPTNWDSFGTYFEHFSSRKRWILLGLMANLGFEYRTQKDGFLYLGFSFHRPFTNITTAGVLYKVDNLEQERTFFKVSGDYLTFDIKYFFNEPNRK